jgi:hypothetical protein
MHKHMARPLVRPATRRGLENRALTCLISLEQFFGLSPWKSILVCW